METVVNKLTDKEKVKVFAMYWGQEILKYESDKDLYPIDRHNIDCKHLYLSLIPLSKITDEHAKQVGKMERDNGCPLEDAELLRKYILDFVHYLSHPTFTYLINNGYAMPVYFEPNHWANGKTPIDLEIAIDKTINQ